MTEPLRPGYPPDAEPEPPRLWRRRQRDIANVLWISFLMAAVATMVFFAMVDPEVLSGTTTPGWEISRQTGYAIGFFGFWALTLASCVLSLFLVRTEHRAEDIPGMRRRLRAARRRQLRGLERDAAAERDVPRGDEPR